MDEKAKNNPGPPRETHELAGLFARLLAMILDSVLMVLLFLLLIFVVSLLGGGDSTSISQVIGFASSVLYNWYFWTRRDGQTPGKFALKIRVIKADGTPLSDTDAVIRAIGYQVSSIVCGLGYIWAIFDKNNQTWHDKLARTYVVTKDRQPKTVEI